MASSVQCIQKQAAGRLIAHSQLVTPCSLRARSAVRAFAEAPAMNTRRFAAASGRSSGSSRAGPTYPVRSGRSRVITRASWGAPVEFSSAKVVSNKPAAPGMHQVVVDVGPTIAAGYTVSGQYIQAKTTADAKAGFFAIASAPEPNNQGVIELLIKSQPGSTAEAICGLAPGAELLVSPVQGKGFPLDRIPAAQFSDVLLFATGSGISPIKAVLESGALDVPSRRSVTLYYGTRSPDATAYAALVPEWTKAGVKVVQVYSGDAEDKKYVQDVFAPEASKLEGGKTGVLLCGQKGMCTAVTDLCKAAGVEQILMNF